jgi:predicted amidohydrolase
MFAQTYKIFVIIYLFFRPLASFVIAIETDVKVAVIHFQPHFRDISSNVERLLQLANEAGYNGAKIVVFPELATSGYSYFNRAEIRQVAETIPGRTTELFAQIAKSHGMYIVIGLPEYESLSNLFYNSAVLIDSNGKIAGIYRKHSHLMESSWSALGNGQVPVFDTVFGKLAILK